jgi:hypothetical protein
MPQALVNVLRVVLFTRQHREGHLKPIGARRNLSENPSKANCETKKVWNYKFKDALGS